MSPQKEITQLLRKADAQLLRQRKHKVFRLRGGAIFVSSSTPGCEQGIRNNLAVLKRLLRSVVQS